MLRLQFPYESRQWAVKRIFLGENLPPTDVSDHKRLGTLVEIAANRQDKPETSDVNAPVGDMGASKSVPSRIPRNMVSSVAASEGDFDDYVEALREDERWRDSSVHMKEGLPANLAARVGRLTSLGAISELSESAFDLTPYQANV